MGICGTAKMYNKASTLSSFSIAFKAWLKVVNNEGDLQRLKDKRYYKKPSEIRRDKKKQALRNAQKKSTKE